MKFRLLCLAVCTTVACGNDTSDTKTIYSKNVSELATGKDAPSEQSQLKSVWTKQGIVAARNLTDWIAEKTASGVEQKRLQVGLFNSEKVQIGKAEVVLHPNDADGFSYSVNVQGLNHSNIRFDVDKATGVMRIQDLVSGKIGNVTPDESTRQFKRDEVASEILAGNEDLLVIGLDVYAGTAASNDSADQGPDEIGISTCGKKTDPMYVCCNGPTFYARDTAAIRSYCCMDAAAQNAANCSNNYCWGCCEQLGCDAWCFAGDYHCSCGALSRSCGVCY